MHACRHEDHRQSNPESDKDWLIKNQPKLRPPGVAASAGECESLVRWDVMSCSTRIIFCQSVLSYKLLIMDYIVVDFDKHVHKLILFSLLKIFVTNQRKQILNA